MKHQIVTSNGSLTCTVCGWEWVKQPTSDCPGVKRYRWGKWGDLLTKKQFSDAGFQIGKKLPAPAGCVQRDDSPGGWMWLYDPAQGVPKRVLSETQKAALAKAAEKARVGWKCRRCGDRLRYYTDGGGLCEDCQLEDRIRGDFDDATKWARKTLKQRNVVILDSETTGLSARYNEIIQLAVIGIDGKPLLNTLIKAEHPERMFERKNGKYGICAHDIHGISPDVLESAPTFPQVYMQLRDLLRDKVVLIYNESFDTSFLVAACDRYRLPRLNARAWEDVMSWYSAWCGEWSRKYGDYRWQPLNGGHTAIEDCQAVIEVLKAMSGIDEFNADEKEVKIGAE